MFKITDFFNGSYTIYVNRGEFEDWKHDVIPGADNLYQESPGTPLMQTYYTLLDLGDWW